MDRKELLKKLEKQEIKRQERMLLTLGGILVIAILIRLSIYGTL